MKILLLSDTHRILRNVKEIFQNLSDSVEMVIHLGDCYDDMEGFVEQYNHLTFHQVLGNCDFNVGKKKEDIIIVNNRKILLTHGSSQDVKYGYDELVEYAQQKEVDICLFGHTHYPIIQKFGELLLMNPGSTSLPRGVSSPGYGILDISEDGQVAASIVGKFKNIYRTVEVV